MKYSIVWLTVSLLIGCNLSGDRRGPSSQGIDDDALQRREAVWSARTLTSRPQVAGREVRTMDGTNNNLAEPTWGATFTHLARWSTADYADGRKSPAGAGRPSARAVSNALHAQSDGESIPNPFGASDFVWQWGQFIDHDVGLTDGVAEFLPIVVPAGDPWFDPRSTGSSIIPFNRALYDPNTGATTPREQENEITAWIDGSMVYGSSDARATALRDVGGRLATSPGDLLPFNTQALTNANGPVAAPDTLFLAGDVRANEQVGLAVMHTLFVREHNRWVAELAIHNPSATDDELYHQARRLVIAQIQKITYEEFLPALIGPNALPAYTGYDPKAKPGLFNAFSVAAFRLGHSMVNASMLRLDESGNPVAAGPLGLRDSFFAAPTVLQSRRDLEPILRGLAAQPHQRLDLKVIHPLRNFLFGEPGRGGLDLVSLNIQRGRDHGVPSYVQMRAAMSLPPVNDFSDITSDVNLAQALRDTYGTVDEVDLWVGGLAEDPLLQQGSQVGPLFRTLLVYQFQALRDGDRFWHTLDLTSQELAMVQDSTLAKIIRANTAIDRGVPDDVFHATHCEPYLQFNHGQDSVIRQAPGQTFQTVMQFGNRGDRSCSEITIRCSWPSGTMADVQGFRGPFDRVIRYSRRNKDFARFSSPDGFDLPPGQNHNVSLTFRPVSGAKVDCRIREDRMNLDRARLEVVTSP